MGPGPAAEMLERRREPPLMELYSSAFENHPTPPKVSGLGVMVAGSRPQGPVGQVSRGLGARPPGLGARPARGLGLFPHKNHPNLSNYDFFANLLVGAWRRRGCRLKRLLRRWGPGGKRSRDTPPHPPPHTLSAFSNHPTRPPRSADGGLQKAIKGDTRSP